MSDSSTFFLILLALLVTDRPLLLPILPLSLGDCWLGSAEMFMEAKLELRLRWLLGSVRPCTSEGFLERGLGEFSGVMSISLKAVGSVERVYKMCQALILVLLCKIVCLTLLMILEWGLGRLSSVISILLRAVGVLDIEKECLALTGLLIFLCKVVYLNDTTVRSQEWQVGENL